MVSVPIRRSIVLRWPVAALGMLGSIAFGLLVGALLVAVFATQFLGYRIATIQSFSMEPALQRGDLIVVRPTNIADAKVGDIVMFEEGRDVKILVAHRVDGVFNVTTNITNGKTSETSAHATKVLRTKGDANDRPDPEYVSADRYQGELLMRIPNVGLIADRLPLQKLLLLVTAASGAAWAVYEWSRHRSRPVISTSSDSSRA